MSFYKKDKNKTQLIISEDSVDILIDAFQSIQEIYYEDIHRKPSISELEELLFLALENNSDDIIEMDGKEIIDCKLKVGKKKSQVLFKPGSVFSIFLPDIQKHGYGMIVKGQNFTRPYDEETYLEYFSLFTEKRLNLSEFKMYYRQEKEVLFTAYSAWSGWIDGGWSKIGDISNSLFDPDSYHLPDFVSFNGGKYLLCRGKADIPLIDREVISKQEGEKIKNPAGILGSVSIEQRLIQLYRNLNLQK